jgi:micrococcal nuclease
MEMNISKDALYFYNAKVRRIYDGDTIFLDIDLGLSMILKNEKIRLARINTPELRGPEKEAGIVARDFLIKLISRKNILLETIKDKKGKYGRYLGEIWVETENGFENVNDLLVKNGHAKFVKY